MIAETSNKVGLEINVSKTKILKINSQELIAIGDQILEDLNCLEYLKSKIDEAGSIVTDIKARTAFASLNKIWNSNNISIKTNQTPR